MGRYQISYSDKKPGYTDKPEIHPIWRGVGFAMMILIPIVSYFTSLLLISANETNRWFVVPADLINKAGDPNLYVKIILTVLLALIIYVLFMVVTFLTHRMFGPARYGPTDAPPIQRKINKRRK